MTDTEREAKLNRFVEHLKAKDPDWELTQEFGRMLMRHIDSFSPEELKRYNELKRLLKQQ